MSSLETKNPAREPGLEVERQRARLPAAEQERCCCETESHEGIVHEIQYRRLDEAVFTGQNLVQQRISPMRQTRTNSKNRLHSSALTAMHCNAVVSVLVD